MGELDRVIGERRQTDSNIRAAIQEIVRLDDFCQQLESAAYVDGNSDNEWERVFDAVFEGGVSRKVVSLSQTIGERFDWCDPDTTYKEDAQAFIWALHEYAKSL